MVILVGLCDYNVIAVVKSTIMSEMTDIKSNIRCNSCSSDHNDKSDLHAPCSAFSQPIDLFDRPYFQLGNGSNLDILLIWYSHIQQDT